MKYKIYNTKTKKFFSGFAYSWRYASPINRYVRTISFTPDGKLMTLKSLKNALDTIIFKNTSDSIYSKRKEFFEKSEEDLNHLEIIEYDLVEVSKKCPDDFLHGLEQQRLKKVLQQASFNELQQSINLDILSDYKYYMICASRDWDVVAKLRKVLKEIEICHPTDYRFRGASFVFKDENIRIKAFLASDNVIIIDADNLNHELEKENLIRLQNKVRGLL